MTPLVEASGIALAGRLQPTNLLLDGGAMTAVIGPNGGGKTSLLRALARIDDPGGRVAVDGFDIDQASPARRGQLLSFLPAARDVPWPISARNVISLGMTGPDPARIDEVIEVLELQSLSDRPIDRLSTGERARVLLGRAIAGRPRLLLLDEPLSNLDPYWALRIVDVLRGLAREGHGLLVSLHDLALADRFDRALLVAGGELVADGPPREILGGQQFSDVFGVERHPDGWRIRQT